MDAKDQRIAELEAEVHRLRGLVEGGGDVIVRKKVRVHARRARDVNEVIRSVQQRRVAELFGGLKLLGTAIVGLAMVVGAYYLVDYVKKSRKPGEFVRPALEYTSQ